jgi:hypothetical protein
MADTTDVAQPTDGPGTAQHQSNRLNQALAWVGIVAGGLFIVAAVFFSGFFLRSSMGGHHMGPGKMDDCCSQMKSGDHMAQGSMMGPGGPKPSGQMTPGQMMPGMTMGPGMMGPNPQSPTTSPPSTPLP